MGIFNKNKDVKNQTSMSQLFDLLKISDKDKNALSEVTYFACIKILSEAIGKLPLKLLRQTSGGGVEKAYEHPLYNVVSVRPNPYINATSFWSSVEFARNHYGNAYVWIVGVGRKTALYLLPSESVSVVIDDTNLWGKKNALWYVLNESKTNKKHLIAHDSILHFKSSLTYDGIVGVSVRDSLKTTLDGNQRAQMMLNKAYKNGFTGKVVLQYTGELAKSLQTEYIRLIEEFKSNPDSDIIPMMLGTNITPIATKLADNQFLELKKYSALQIASAFGIKPNQINDYEKSSYASAEAQQLAFYVDTLLYILKQYEEEISNKLLSEKEIVDGYYFKFNVSVILRADLKTQIESLNTAVQGGIKTPNEARTMLDLPNVDGGDVLICNGNMMPVKMAGEQFKKENN